MAAGQLVFGPFRLDADGGSLWRGDHQIPLAPRPFALLQYLAERPGRLVTKDELLDTVWAGVIVGDAVLKVAVREVRKALGDSTNAPLFVETVHGRGYRFRGGARAGQLPVLLTSFVGRDAELTALDAALQTHRLVTLRGAGGVGKTRLAREIADRQRDRFADGIWWVELAGVDRPDLVVSALAATLGIRDSRDHPIVEALADFVRPRTLLIALDNCEHVLAGCVPVVARLLGVAPHLSVLATSREPLGLAGEKVFVVPPLDVPPPDATSGAVRAAAAVRLFMARAADADPSWAVTPETVRAAAAICRRLDGLPLAIEIVAARAGALSAPDLLAHVDAGLAGVARDRGVDAGRHRSLEAAFAWSYDLLDAGDREFLQQLAVFPSTFSIEAADAVCRTASGSSRERLAALVDKSLVSTLGGAEPGRRRYRLLELIRAWVRDKTTAAERAGPEKRHADWFAALAALQRPLLNSAGRTIGLAALTAERDNLRTALAWSLNADPAIAIRLTANVWWWWFHTNQWRDGRGAVEAALQRSPAPDAARAEALCGAGALAWFQGDHEHARDRLDQSIAVARTTGPGHVLIRALDFLGQVEADLGALDAATRHAREAVATARALKHGWELGVSLTGFGNVLLFTGAIEESVPAYAESVNLLRETGDRWALGMALRNLGVVTRRRGRVGESLAIFRESLESLREVDDTWFVSRTIEELAKSLAAQAAWRDVVLLLGASEALREAVGAVVLAARRAELAHAIDGAKVALGDAAFAALWRSGRSLSRDDAISAAIAIVGPSAA